MCVLARRWIKITIYQIFWKPIWPCILLDRMVTKLRRDPTYPQKTLYHLVEMKIPRIVYRQMDWPNTNWNISSSCLSFSVYTFSSGNASRTLFQANLCKTLNSSPQICCIRLWILQNNHIIGNLTKYSRRVL